MKLAVHDVHLPLRHPFATSHGTATERHNLIVALEQDGVTGYGEAATSHGYPQFAAPVLKEALETARPAIEAATLTDPPTLWESLRPHLAHVPFALCAVDQAAHDLWGKLHGKPVWELWGFSLDRLPVSNYTIGIDTVPAMLAKMQEFDGWPVYKIKLGTPDDLEILRTLRKHTDAAFRVDANTGWTADGAIALAPELEKLGVEFIEQPLKPDDGEGMARLKDNCPLPLVADESCQVESDVDRCADHFDAVNIKLTKAGGLTPARRMVDRARALGLDVMVGCMTESSVGISATAQLLPLLDYADLDGSLLIARDVATGVHLDHGHAIFPDHPGTGTQPIPAALESLSFPT